MTDERIATDAAMRMPKRQRGEDDVLIVTGGHVQRMVGTVASTSMIGAARLRRNVTQIAPIN